MTTDLPIAMEDDTQSIAFLSRSYGELREICAKDGSGETVAIITHPCAGAPWHARFVVPGVVLSVRPHASLKTRKAAEAFVRQMLEGATDAA